MPLLLPPPPFSFLPLKPAHGRICCRGLTVYTQLTYTVELLREGISQEENVHDNEWNADPTIQFKSRHSEYKESDNKNEEEDEAELGVLNQWHLSSS